jgi:hypothetical protein
MMDKILESLNSNAFGSIVTLIVGFSAYLIYKKQKEDSKRDAANIILLEIQTAERILAQVGNDIREKILPNKFLLPTESWSKYKYYFVRDFDRDEWDLITDFYNNASLYDEAVMYNNSLFQKNEEQIRVNMLNIPAKYIDEFLQNQGIDVDTDSQLYEKGMEEALTKSEKFQTSYLSRIGSLFYSPNKPLLDAIKSFDNINKMLSQTSIGNKLKKLSGLKTS